jgi:hypothetical protein
VEICTSRMIFVSVKGTPLQMQEQTENDIRTLLLAGWLSQLLVNKIDSIAACLFTFMLGLALSKEEKPCRRPFAYYFECIQALSADPRERKMAQRKYWSNHLLQLNSSIHEHSTHIRGSSCVFSLHGFTDC